MAEPYAYTPAPDQRDTIVRWARVLLTLALVPLSWHAFHDQYAVVPLVGDIDLAIHEFGHMLFMPFGILILGQWMMILGGSLVQVVFPSLFVAYFLNGKRDVHAAMVCLWWVSINLLGVAIYMADSRAGVLMLINGLTGQDSDGHDWRQLFEHWGVLQQDTLIGGRVRIVARMLCVVSIAGGLIAAWTTTRASPEAAAATADAAGRAMREASPAR
jgi:hypothetical protein